MGKGHLNRTSVKRINFKYQMGKGDPKRPSMQGKLQISNGKRRSKQVKHVIESGQACNGDRPSMQWRQAKHEMRTGQACKRIRPSTQ
ncbi:hypothetical protein TNCV_1324791 [Trichonephila clavipes]|nr:hypothetical protein TNCV_1324791 [Trichonephila clavipes]